MADKVSDTNVLDHIGQLVKEEQALYGQGTLDSHAQDRLEAIKVQLDQSWDLLRQRRALREFDKDPDSAKIRRPDIVENYEQ